jgi:hypothetical protein
MKNQEIKADTVYQVVVYFEGVFSSHGFYEDLREAEQKRDCVASDMWNADADGKVFITEIKY